MSTILVTGGTGTLGTLVTARLRARGHDVRVLSRHSPEYPVDLVAGTGLDAAMAGADTVVHCASATRSAGKGDEEAARNLVAAARRAGLGHLVYISIVGVDAVPFPYYRRKLAVERILTESGLGVTVLRTTQFHDLVKMAAEALGKLPVVLVPKGIPVQPVATGDVAARLAELAEGSPAGRAPDFGGPETRTLDAWLRAYYAGLGKRRAVVPVPLFGRAYAAFRRGGITAPEHSDGTGTFAAYVAALASGTRPEPS
ncbi:SDR family oxidoreductase [Streptomyces sp. NRRL S-87]|uniref:SDR family oxidoreductase n=1 Tax=Streptomyces sp. NRRL S-87 TaxID=1463920 RepID=UPI0004BED57C|nr:NAD(P)H-binding protein [Streptomyces sp. NRRL S-87]